MIVLFLACTAAPLSAQSPAAFDAVQIGAHVYFPDGRRVSTWQPLSMGRIPNGGIYTVDTLCAFNAPLRDDRSGYGWQFEVTGTRIIRGSERNLVAVRVDWKRTRHEGLPVNGPAGSVELTLAPGAAIPLDYIVPAPVPAGRSCSAVGMLLEMSMQPR